MIDMSIKKVTKRMLLTLFKSNLYFEGSFDFWIKEKNIVKLYRQELPSYCLYLSTEDGIYADTVEVKYEEYKKARINNYFGKCGVVSHKYKDRFYVITRNTEDKYAIREIVKESRFRMIFLLFVLILIAFSCFILLRNLIL